MRDIPQEWIKQYVDKLLEVAQEFDTKSIMRERMLERAEHILDMVQEFHHAYRRTGIDRGKS